MTTTDTGWQPPPPSTPRLLRRSRTDRIGVGVAGGLGAYFHVDPVLFRVLFAVSVFFGGAGILAYVIAWAAIPEEGTANPPIDRFIAELRRRRIPIWLVAVATGIVLWALAFSWWIPHRFIPVWIVVIALVILFSRHRRSVPPDTTQSAAAPEPVLPAEVPTTPGGTTAAPGSPEWAASTRAWVSEARIASRERRRRAFPVRITILLALAGTLTALGIADAVTGIRLPVYFWVTAAIVGLGLLTGTALRRTPWSMAPLLVPALVGMIALGTTSASLHDGIGVTDWTPPNPSALRADYRLAVGQATLDLRSLPPANTTRDIHVTMAAGQARILLPATLNATVEANVRIGVITADGTRSVGGYDSERTIPPPAGATGAPITIFVHIADGNIAAYHSH